MLGQNCLWTEFLTVFIKSTIDFNSRVENNGTYLKASLPCPLKDNLVEETGLGKLLSAWKWPKRWAWLRNTGKRRRKENQIQKMETWPPQATYPCVTWTYFDLRYQKNLTYQLKRLWSKFGRHKPVIPPHDNIVNTLESSKYTNTLCTLDRNNHLSRQKSFFTAF